jgi:hypothetical protein
VHPRGRVDDDRVDITAVANPRHHLQELRPPIYVGGRTTRLDVLVHDLEAQLLGLPSADSALRGDRVVQATVNGLRVVIKPTAVPTR